MAQISMSKLFEWDRWHTELPWLSFPADVEVKVTPPIVGAVIRFRCRLRDNPAQDVSVYFDAYNQLGHMDHPYWEIYPVPGDDPTRRYYLGEEPQMVADIVAALRHFAAAPREAQT